MNHVNSQDAEITNVSLFCYYKYFVTIINKHTVILNTLYCLSHNVNDVEKQYIEQNHNHFRIKVTLT